jgi:hypothetical protein
MISFKSYKSLSFSNDKIYDRYFHLTEDEFNMVISTAEKYKMNYIDYDNCFRIISYNIKESDDIRKALIELRKKVPNLSIVGIADYNKKEYENIVYLKRQLETLSNEQDSQIKMFQKRYPELWNKLMNS